MIEVCTNQLGASIARERHLGVHMAKEDDLVSVTTRKTMSAYFYRLNGEFGGHAANEWE